MVSLEMLDAMLMFLNKKYSNTTNKPHYLSPLHVLGFRKHLFGTHGSNLDCLPKLFITNLTGFISIPLFLVK